MKKLLKFSSVIAIVVGIILLIGSIWGVWFTYTNIARENIITTSDSSIPNTPVRGPLTLNAQSNIIRKHVLSTTDGKTFAEMPRMVPKLNQNGDEVLDKDGKAVMIPNTARDLWITATTLTTALNLGIITYVFSFLVMLLGCISVWTGIIFFQLSKRNFTLL